MNVNCRYILEARGLSILSMIRTIKKQLMTRFYNKREEAETWDGTVCPKIKKRLEKNDELSATCHHSNAEDGIFQVI